MDLSHLPVDTRVRLKLTFMEALWLLSSLNHMTVIPTGILTSTGSNGELPSELKGIVIVYDGILFNWYNIGGGKVVLESVGRSSV